MKILVFSDSHRSDTTIRRALALHGSSASLALHAGDGAHSFMLLSSEYPAIGFYAVRGNCDSVRSLFGGSPLRDEETVSAEGVNILLTHGHLFGVKSSPLSLAASAGRRGYGLAVFGHTHEPYEKYIPGKGGLSAVRLFNPGAAKDGRYGIIDIRENGILTQHASVY